MAQTLTIYPIQDVTLNHSCSSGSTGYNLINNATSDSDSSYIYQSVSTSSSTKISTFKCGSSSMTDKIYLISLESTVICGNNVDSTKNSTSFTSSVTTGVSINGGSVTSGTQHSTSGTPGSTSTSYQTFNDTFSSPSGVNQIYNSINDADIRLRISTTASIGSSNSYTNQYRVTSGNLTITYDYVFECQAVNLTGSGISSASVSATDVRDGGICTFSCTPESGYLFSGWYDDANYTNLVSSSQTYTATITADTTLYAKASPLYNITVYGDDGCTATSSKSSGYYGETATVTATILDATTHEFLGWYSNPERTTLVSSDNPYTFTIHGDTVLYAHTKTLDTMYIKLNGHWTACREVYVKVDGHWELADELEGLFDTTKHYIPVQE